MGDMTEEDAPLGRAEAFEWDENKRRSNLAKHGIDFDDAKEVFYDPAACTFLSSHAVNERRLVTVGLMGGALVAVISARRGKAIRIISARPARRSEKLRYEAEGKKETQ